MQQRRKEFFKYIVPSAAALMVMSLYIVVDGIFVGQGIGKNALASVNIAMPFALLITAFSMMLTTGGATVTSIRLGRGDIQSANRSFMTSIILVLIMSTAISFVGVVFPQTIAGILGASPLLAGMTADYVRYYSMFSIFFAMSLTLATFVRNDSNPNLALAGMIAGAVTNIFLDWLFVFPLQMGVVGAAIASGLGQTVSVIVLSMHFILKKGVLRFKRERISFNLMRKVTKRGMPEFISQLAQPVTILCFNTVILQTLGEIGVSAFSVIGYTSTVVYGALYGISTGIQPLISKSFGAGDRNSQQYYYRMALIANFVVFSVIYAVLFFWGRHVFTIFNSDSQLLDIAHNGIKVYQLSLLLAGVNLVYNTLFMSTKRTNRAVVISLSRSIIFNALFIFAVPFLLGSGAVWWGIVIAEFVTLLISLGMKLQSRKKQ